MGAIVLDTSKVNSLVISCISQSKSDMQTSYNTSVSLKNSLPSTYNNRSLVSQITSQIYNLRKEIGDINGIIEKKVERAKTIETKRDGAARTIASSVAKIGAATIAATGATVKSVVSAQTKKKKKKTKKKTTKNTGAKESKSFISKVGSFFAGAWKGVKKTASKIAKGVKSVASKVKSAAKTAMDWVADKFKAAKDWTCKAIKNTGAWISKAAKATWSWLKNAGKTVWKHMKKIGASFVNGVLALVKGVVSLVEAIGDFIILLGSGIATIGTALWDIGKGLCTGKWDWGATKGLWKGTKSVVAYDWTSKCIFDPLYRTGFGKWLDNNAYGWFKSDGIGCTILQGVGYVAGVVILTVATFGVGGVAVGSAATVSAGVSATTLAVTATAAGIGKYTAEEWNKNSLSINYGGNNMDISIDYEKYTEIEKLKDGQSTTFTQQLMGEDGKPFEMKFTITKNGNSYSIVDSNGNAVGFNGVKESDTAKGLAVGVVKGAWEGAQYYVGGKIGGAQFTKLTSNISSPVAQTIVRSGTRVGLDVATGVVEVPFQSVMTMASEGKSWNEAWEANGGWQAVGTQAGIAGLSSFAGEAFSFKGNVNTQKLNTEILPGNTELVENTLDNTKLENTNRVLNNLTDENLIKNTDASTKNVKLLDMDAEGIRNSIKEEISQLDSSASDYAKKVTLLLEKESLEKDLIDKMSKLSIETKSATKSIDLLSLSDQQQVKKAAQLIYDKAVSEETAVTQAMKQLVDSETTLAGLDFKIKSMDSIEDKIARKLYQGYSVNAAQDSINDSLRYTLIVNGNYEETVLKKLSLLQKDGFMVYDLNNAWGKSTYQGLNVTLKNQDGLLVELQFHTPDSFNVKQVMNHDLYELSRNTSTSPEIRSISDRIQYINQEIYVGRDTTFKFDNVNSLNEAIKNFGVFKNYKAQNGYTDFLVENQKNIDAWNNAVAQDPKLGDYMQQYKGESMTDPASYKIANARLRGTLFDDANQTVKISGTGGYPVTYTYSEFEKMIGCSIDEFKVRIDDSIKCLGNGISECHLAADTELIRGVNWDTLKFLFDINEQDPIDVINSKLAAKGIWTEPGFMSACPSVAEGDIPWIVSSKKIRLVMTCESGIDARIFPNDICEKEVLLNYGQSFNINKAEYGSDGILYIYMDHIPK